MSPDEQYLLCVMKKGAVAHVFDLAPDSDRSFTLSEGAAGLAHACWTPSNHVLTCVPLNCVGTPDWWREH